jgi:hypothetical protein
MRAFGKEFGNIAQGDDLTGTKGTNCVHVMSHEEIENIPADRVVTYAKIVVDYRPQKDDPNRVRITVGGNLIDYPGELTVGTADLTTAKLLWNSVISTEGAKFMGLDIKSFYIMHPMDRYEYMKIPISLFPQHTIEQYNLKSKVKGGFVYLEIRATMYGLPQAGILANKALREHLKPFGYYESAHTPGLWRHVTRPIQFTLVVDDFGIKYSRKEDVDHLIKCLRKKYELSEDWEGEFYIGIQLDWHYEPDNRYVDLRMPGYADRLRQRFGHKKPARKQNSPYKPAPRKYGKAAQDALAPDTSPLLDEKRKKRIQQIVGGAL